MSKKSSFYLVATFVLTALSAASAQQLKKVARIGYLGSGSNVSVGNNARVDPVMTPFRERLRALGYIEGQNVVFESRYWEGKVERLPELAAELVRLHCDVIFTTGNEAAGAAKNATKEIPIVIANTQDAVASGFVASLAHPGGNVTGLTSVGPELIGKQVELFKEIIPKLSRAGFLWSADNPVAASSFKEAKTAAKFLKITLQSLEVKGPDEFEGVFQTAAKMRAEALVVVGGGFFAANQDRIIELALKHRLPATYNNARYVEAGGLMTYSTNRPEQYRRAADYVDKILKGTKPANLPVELRVKFELVINLKTAKQIGLKIPADVLLRADRVIK